MSAKPRYEITEEQKAAMLARAEEIGVQNAAKEYGVPWQTIAQYKRRAKEQTEKETAAEKPATAETVTAEGPAAVETASDAPAAGKGKQKKTAKAKKTKDASAAKSDDATPEKPDTAAAVKDAPETKADASAAAAAEALKIENAVLQDRIARLEAQVAKLTRAMRELI